MYYIITSKINKNGKNERFSEKIQTDDIYSEIRKYFEKGYHYSDFIEINKKQFNDITDVNELMNSLDYNLGKIDFLLDGKKLGDSYHLLNGPESLKNYLNDDNMPLELKENIKNVLFIKEEIDGEDIL